jgi:trans-aconitate methyltransferase
MSVDPYELVARFYEIEFEPHQGDVAYFERVLGPGRLLVLGCGTGRVARPLAAGRSVVGLDRSAPMLQIARQKAPHVDWVEGDMRDFALGAFAEVLIPNASFAFLTSRADQAACLGSCRRALPDGGRLLIDVPMPDVTRWGEAHTPEKTAFEGQLDGRHVKRTREVRRSIARQRLELLDRYYVDGARVADSLLVLRVTLPGEMEWMLESAGFYVDEIVGDYSGGSLKDHSPRLLVHAVAA